jgi:hypothetical protein
MADHIVTVDVEKQTMPREDLSTVMVLSLQPVTSDSQGSSSSSSALSLEELEVGPIALCVWMMLD